MLIKKIQQQDERIRWRGEGEELKRDYMVRESKRELKKYIKALVNGRGEGEEKLNLWNRYLKSRNEERDW